KDIDGEALTACILNKLRDQLQVAAVKVPGFGDNRKFILGDLTILTGGTIFTDELDVKLEKSSPDLLDSSGSITITKEDTIVFNGEGSKDAIQAHCEQIHTLLADPSTSEYDKTKLQERFAKLSQGAAVIKARDGTDVDVGEKKDMYDYPLNAERAAVEEGILPGSGVASLKASLALATNTSGSSSSP
ncbi:GroEL-like apical domain-containing protein, partial [Pisolithus tinctorius]